MKYMLKRLWNEYFSDKCAKLTTEEEKELANRALGLHQAVVSILTQEQLKSVENYIDILLEMQSVWVKKAFAKGCEFSVSFLLETGALGE